MNSGTQNRSWSSALSCFLMGCASAVVPISSVMRSLVKKYSSRVSGSISADKAPITSSHRF